MGTEAELASFKAPHDTVIITSRLKLRPVYPLTDIHIIHRMRRNPNSMKHMCVSPDPTPLPLPILTSYDSCNTGQRVSRQKKTLTNVLALIE